MNLLINMLCLLNNLVKKRKLSNLIYNQVYLFFNLNVLQQYFKMYLQKYVK